MEPLLSAIMSELLSRALSTVIQRYRRSKAEEAEQNLQGLQRVLLRVDATIEEAEGRHITNQAMLRQLEMLRQGMYEGHFMLDTFRCRGHEHGDGNEGIGGQDDVLSRFNSARRLLSFPIISSKESLKNTMHDAENLKKLEKMVDRFETLMGDMVEFAVFLHGYPRIGRGPYSEYMVIDKVMFGRQMEKETVINFLLRSEAAGDGKPGVLPIVGAMRVGKSTLVEHVCLDERVRGYFSSIFFVGDDLGAENMVIKHQNLTASSCQRSLVVIELAGDIEDEMWRSFYCSAARSLGCGSMIIITSQSEKIAALGTTQALRLKFLPQEAYWYLFKVLAFGSANSDEQPELVSLGMEIAVLLKGSFIGAHMVGSLMRANLNPKFWRRMLQVRRNLVSKHLLMFGEHPEDLLAKGHPVYLQTTAKSQNVIVNITNLYQKRSALHSVPKMRTRDLILGRATRHVKFGVVEWSSSIPPYYTYLASCESLTTGCTIVRKKRPRQELV